MIHILRLEGSTPVISRETREKLNLTLKCRRYRSRHRITPHKFVLWSSPLYMATYNPSFKAKAICGQSDRK